MSDQGVPHPFLGADIPFEAGLVDQGVRDQGDLQLFSGSAIPFEEGVVDQGVRDQGDLQLFSGSTIPFEAGVADQGALQIREYSTLSLAQSYLLRQEWQIRECRSGCTPDQGVQIRMYSRSGSGRSGSSPPFPWASHTF